MMTDDGDLMQAVDTFMAELAVAPIGAETGAGALVPLPPVHDADDPWAKPTAPCAACGELWWRVWSHDGGASWQWICNRCRPLVVYNRDGTVWRSDAP